MRRATGERRKSAGGRRGAAPAVAAAMLLFAAVAHASRTELKPGWNIFTPQQDIEIGQKNAQQVEKQLPMLNNPRVDNYLNQLGHRLAAHAPGYKFPYSYRCVNSEEINAFALPGGPIFINRGVIEHADDEAQLAAVMAHETSHVALRHGTNQASKQSLAQLPLAALGGLLGGNAVGDLAAQLGGSLGINSLFLKFSRTDESQADVLGTQILYDTGYDPRAMAQFFEKIQAESKHQPIQFFSDHPNPDNRIGRVDEEIDKLGGPPPNAITDSPEFEQIKALVKSLPPPPKSGAGGGAPSPAPRSSSPPPAPSSGLRTFSNADLQAQHPDNWQVYGEGSEVTIAPQGGIVDDGKGGGAMAYGMIIGSVMPESNTAPGTLDNATDRLIDQLRSSNPHMTMIEEHQQTQVGGSPALSTLFRNDSPLGGQEKDWLVTVQRSDGLHYFIGTAPEADFPSYQKQFEAILNSVHFLK